MEAWAILALAVRQLFVRMFFYVRANALYLLACLPIVTWPPATAALFHLIREGLEDPFENRVRVWPDFWVGFRRYFWRSYGLAALNFGALVVLWVTLLFWLNFPYEWLQLLAVPVIYFLLFWLLCQPYLWTLLVHEQGARVLAVVRMAPRIVITRPWLTINLILVLAILTVVGVILAGPVLILLFSLQALICTQVWWLIQGRPVLEGEE